jgi:predicted signal transduction protein with EAL and GGDEF domain
LRPGDRVARLGGDEFTLLIRNISDVGEAAQVAERVRQELTQPFNLNGQQVFTTVSVGIAYSAMGYEKPEDMLRDADTAMYSAKASGKARHEIFDKEMHSRTRGRLQIETDLRRAIENKEFSVHYQPIVALETGKLRGFEALVRWEHPEQGLISPARFIPIAEDTGLIVDIGRHVLYESCRQMREWQLRYPHGFNLQVSVNLSSVGQAVPSARSDRADQIYPARNAARCKAFEAGDHRERGDGECRGRHQHAPADSRAWHRAKH